MKKICSVFLSLPRFPRHLHAKAVASLPREYNERENYVNNILDRRELYPHFCRPSDYLEVSQFRKAYELESRENLARLSGTHSICGTIAGAFIR